jgi:hypothetical protein
LSFDIKLSLGNIGGYSQTMAPEQVLAFVRKEQDTWLLLQKINEW